MKKALRALLLSTFGLAACAHTSGLTVEGERVEIGKGNASADMTELGALDVADGPVCGTTGTAGTYEGALATLRNTAGRLGADYVQVLTTRNDDCGRLVVRGLAYKRGS